jgi:multiple sugar transport system permease protein
MLVLNIGASAYGLLLSFLDWSYFRPETRGQWVGLSNYQAVVSDPVFRTALVNTALWTVVVVPCAFAVGLYFALLLNEDVKFKGVFRTAILLPWATPLVVTGILWRFALTPQIGIVDDSLVQIGLRSFGTKNWLGDPGIVMPILLAIQIWVAAPFFTIVLLAGLQSIPAELHEAAAIDGAGALSRFRNVTLPLLRPVVAVVVLQGIVLTFQSFTLVFVMTQGGPANRTQLLTVYLSELAFGEGQVARAAAVGAILITVLLIVGTAWISSLLAEDDTA